jgi:hypothetical protein
MTTSSRPACSKTTRAITSRSTSSNPADSTWDRERWRQAIRSRAVPWRSSSIRFTIGSGATVFKSTPGALQSDAIWTEAGGVWDFSYDGIWESEARLTGSGYNRPFHDSLLPRKGRHSNRCVKLKLSYITSAKEFRYERRRCLHVGHKRLPRPHSASGSSTHSGVRTGEAVRSQAMHALVPFIDASDAAWVFEIYFSKAERLGEFRSWLETHYLKPPVAALPRSIALDRIANERNSPEKKRRRAAVLARVPVGSPETIQLFTNDPADEIRLIATKLLSRAS